MQLSLSKRLTAVLTEPGRGDPHASKTTLVVPAIPRKELFLVDPLGRSVATFSQPHYAATLQAQYNRIRRYFDGAD